MSSIRTILLKNAPQKKLIRLTLTSAEERPRFVIFAFQTANDPTILVYLKITTTHQTMNSDF